MEAAAGFDRPILHYNVGIVSYKLGEYESAEGSFRRAAANPDLAAIATYNLGLTYRRLGRLSDAGAAFRSAANASRNRELADLASRAASSVAAPFERSAETQQLRRGDRAVPARDEWTDRHDQIDLDRVR